MSSMYFVFEYLPYVASDLEMVLIFVFVLLCPRTRVFSALSIFCLLVLSNGSATLDSLSSFWFSVEEIFSTNYVCTISFSSIFYNFDWIINLNINWLFNNRSSLIENIVGFVSHGIFKDDALIWFSVKIPYLIPERSKNITFAFERMKIRSIWFSPFFSISRFSLFI